MVAITPCCWSHCYPGILCLAKNCKPKDCVDLKCYRVSTAKDGPHTIYPGTPNLPTLQVSCDQATVGDGWIVLMRRVDGSVNFSRTWTEYRNGFGQHGDESTEMWLSNEKVHQMVNSYGNTKCELRLEGYAFDGTSCIITSGKFRLRNEARRYAIEFNLVGADTKRIILDWANHFGSNFKTIDNRYNNARTNILANAARNRSHCQPPSRINHVGNCSRALQKASK